MALGKLPKFYLFAALFVLAVLALPVAVFLYGTIRI